MPRKIKDLAVKTGSYVDREGQQKGRYENVGNILQMDDGSKMMLMKRTFNPAGVPNPDGRDTIIISVFDVKEQQSQSQPPAAFAAPASPKAAAPQSAPVIIDDDIPF